MKCARCTAPRFGIATLCRECLESHRALMRNRYRQSRGIGRDEPLRHAGRPRITGMETN